MVGGDFLPMSYKSKSRRDGRDISLEIKADIEVDRLSIHFTRTESGANRRGFESYRSIFEGDSFRGRT